MSENQMNGEQKMWCVFFICVAAAICTIVGGLVYYHSHQNALLFENGYEQRTIDGVGYPVWVKSGKPASEQP